MFLSVIFSMVLVYDLSILYKVWYSSIIAFINKLIEKLCCCLFYKVIFPNFIQYENQL